MDRWQWRPALISLLIVTVLTLLCGLPGDLSFILIPLTGLISAIVLIVIVIVSVTFAVKKRPRHAASLLLAVIAPIVLWTPINWAADCIHLGLTVGFGMGQLGHSPNPNGSGYQTYDWSVGLAGGANTFLIHDPSDEITKPSPQTKVTTNSENGLEEECSGKVKHLLAHYYVCTFY
jgi:hypothetical protein